MKLTRERKIFASVLVIALAGLGFDQLRGTSATDPSQADAGTLLLASNGSSNKRAQLAANPGEEISLAHRLAALANTAGPTSTNDIRDVFRAADVWLPKTVAAITTVAPADKFAADHKLGTISTNTAGGGVAVVDGKPLHMGGRIDGYRLVEINGQGATFQSSDGARAHLKLASEPIASGQ
jgi:hypothetical protein